MTNEHLTDNALEQFALGRLPDAELLSFDAHLSSCTTCQDRLAETESYVASMQIALSRVAREPAPATSGVTWLSWARPAFAVAAGVLVVVLALPLLRHSGSPQVIELAAVRSSATTPAAVSGSLELHLAAPAGSPEQVDVHIVDDGGAQKWTGHAGQVQGKWVVKVDSLSSGRYWVRVSAGGHNPLHEYPLVLK